MSMLKTPPKGKVVTVEPTGTTVWAEPAKKASKSAAGERVAAKKATVKRPPGFVTVTILDTPLRPKHSSRAILEAAVRAVK